MTIPIVNTSDFAMPQYATAGSAGMDLYANIIAPLTLQSLERALVPTGIFIALPQGYEGQVRPRSGLALKRGLTCLNSPGTIDSDYRGEVKVILANLSAAPQTIERGERIAQLVIAEYVQISWLPVADLAVTERGAGGFGSTGTA
jgi:dUTP pyrophosphatase